MVRLSGCLFSLDKIAGLLRNGAASRTVVMAGAGASVPSGIPDFRTPGSGLYDNLGEYNLPYPLAIFDINYFRQNPKPFYQVAKQLYPGLYPPNDCHWFVRLLADKNQLQRMYTQNIDGLETLTGLSRKLLVEAHGSFSTASCQTCFEKYEAKEVKEAIFADEVPTCTKCQGVIKPDIVFFGEMLPQRFMLNIKDMATANLLIVMGTSLEVFPFAGLADMPRWSVPRLLINRETVGSFVTDPRDNDVIFNGDVEEGVQKLVELCGWTDDLKQLRKSYTESTANEE